MKVANNISLMDMMNLHNKVDKTKEEEERLWEERKNNSKLDRALYLSDLNKVFEEQFKAENLAKKLAKGETLTQEERAFLEKVNPQLLKDAEKAKQEAENLKNQLKNAKDKQAAQKIIEQASYQANMVAKYNMQYANLLKEAIAKVCDEEQGSQYKDNANEIIEKIFGMNTSKSRFSDYA